jgi:hypothetical protein
MRTHLEEDIRTGSPNIEAWISSPSSGGLKLPEGSKSLEYVRQGLPATYRLAMNMLNVLASEPKGRAKLARKFEEITGRLKEKTAEDFAREYFGRKLSASQLQELAPLYDRYKQQNARIFEQAHAILSSTQHINANAFVEAFTRDLALGLEMVDATKQRIAR